jgi:hypothetical protein
LESLGHWWFVYVFFHPTWSLSGQLQAVSHHLPEPLGGPAVSRKRWNWCDEDEDLGNSPTTLGDFKWD